MRMRKQGEKNKCLSSDLFNVNQTKAKMSTVRVNFKQLMLLFINKIYNVLKHTEIQVHY